MPSRRGLRANQTVNGYLLKKVGLQRAFHVEMFISLWALAMESLGREPTPKELVEGTSFVSRSTLFRWQAAFREAFPDLETPGPLIERAAALPNPPTRWNIQEVAALPFEAVA